MFKGVIELTPVYSLNRAKSFLKGYRNVIVKLTFPDEKILRLEIAEDQISGRVIYIPIECDHCAGYAWIGQVVRHHRPFHQATLCQGFYDDGL